MTQRIKELRRIGETVQQLNGPVVIILFGAYGLLRANILSMLEIQINQSCYNHVCCYTEEGKIFCSLGAELAGYTLIELTDEANYLPECMDRAVKKACGAGAKSLVGIYIKDHVPTAGDTGQFSRHIANLLRQNPPDLQGYDCVFEITRD